MSYVDEQSAVAEAVRQLIGEGVQPVSRRRTSTAGATPGRPVTHAVSGPGGGASVLSARKLVDDEGDTRVWVRDSGDIDYFKDDGVTYYAQWDQINDQLELFVDLSLGGQNLIDVSSIRASTNQILVLEDEDGDTRFQIRASTPAANAGDLEFFKDDGLTLSLIWDQSDNRWEFADDVQFDGGLTLGANLQMAGYDINQVGAIYGNSGEDLIIQPASGEELFIRDDGGLRIRLYPAATGDIQIYKADHATTSLLWDQSADRWEFATDVRITSAGNALQLVGSDAGLYQYWYNDGTNLSASFAHYGASDDFFITSERGNLVIEAKNAETGTGANIEFKAEDSGGVSRTRWLFEGSTGDAQVRKVDGSTISLLWDQSADRWEFATDVRITSAGNALQLVGSDAGLYQYWYNDGTNLSASFAHYGASDDFFIASERGNLVIEAKNAETGTGANIEFKAEDSGGVSRTRWLFEGSTGDAQVRKVDGSTISLLWDQSDDRWEFGTDVITSGQLGVGVTTISAQAHIDQASTTAAIPVLYLDQADVSEEMIQFESTIGVGNAIEAVGAKTLTTTHFIKVTLPGGLTRYLPVGTIA